MLRAVFVFAVCLLASSFVYREAPIAFLRGESGLLLSWSHADEATQQLHKQSFFTESNGGQYTPLAYLAEFEIAKRVGTREIAWRRRQIFALALVATISFLTLARVLRLAGVAASVPFSLAAAATALGIFQPAMVDFVAWPFMIMELLWIALFLLALYAVTQLARAPNENKWPWTAVAAAYASMHCSGLGFVTVGAVTAALAALCLNLSGSRRRILPALLTLDGFAIVHSCVAIHFAPPHAPAIHSLGATKLLFGFVYNFLWAGLRTFSVTSLGQPVVASVAFCWPLGLLVVLALFLALSRIYQLLRRDLRPDELAAVNVAVFSIAAFGMLAWVVALRQTAVAGTAGAIVPFFETYFARPQDIIPLHYVLVAPIALSVAYLAKSAPRSASVVCCAIIIAAAISQLEFQRGPMKSFMPESRISHASIWHLLSRAARECRAAGLPLPNLPMRAVTMLPDSDVRFFLPLLRAQLRLKPEEKLKLSDWPPPSGAANENARKAVPSQERLERKLNLRPARTDE